MLYSANDVSQQLNEKIKLLDETLNAINEPREKSKRYFILILIIVAVIFLLIGLRSCGEGLYYKTNSTPNSDFLIPYFIGSSLYVFIC